jgi:hypothetical protein
MFRRRWIWFGKLISDERFSIAFGNRSVRYSDARGTFTFGFEDDLLFPNPMQILGESHRLDSAELNQVIDRIKRGLEFEGHAVRVFDPGAKQ